MDWKEESGGLYKQFMFTNFLEAFDFMQEIAKVAEEKQHHPRWENEWNKVRIWLKTHDASDQITDKDHSLAKDIDFIFERFNNKKLTHRT